MSADFKGMAREILNRACVAGTSERYPDLLDDLAQALLSIHNSAVERCMKAVCKGCELEWEIKDGSHRRQILTSKDKKGHYVYNEADKPCLATAIRGLASRCGKRKP